MIIVDKTQRRPPSRLVDEEHERIREHENLVHENLEGCDYLVQEYCLDPDSDTIYMVINTYLDNDTYKATICPIGCELQNISILQ
jgi:hypothetical protein